MFPSAFLDEMRKDAQLPDDLSPISLAIRLLHARAPVYRPRISEMSLERIPCIHGFQDSGQKKEMKETENPGAAMVHR